MLKKICLMLIMLAIGFVFGTSVMAERKVRTFTLGTELAKDMKQYEEIRDCKYCYGYYVGYIAGVHDANGFSFDRIPTEITLDKTCKIVAQYLKSHPDSWDTSAADLVVSAIKEAFPEKQNPEQSSQIN